MLTLRRALQPRVLMYHCFGERSRRQDPDDLFVRPDRFARQLDVLRKGGWETLSSTRYTRARCGARTPWQSVLVTIDDAHRSVVDIALPELLRTGVPAIVFTPAGLIDGTMAWEAPYACEPLCGPDELRTLVAAGMEIGVHGWDHRPMVDLDKASLRRHTVEAGEAIADVTGRRPTTFAYPYGLHDRAARAAVARAGYSVAFSTDRGSGRHAVQRAGVSAIDDELAFRVKLLPRYRDLRRMAIPIRSARRAVRRAVGA